MSHYRTVGAGRTVKDEWLNGFRMEDEQGTHDTVSTMVELQRPMILVVDDNPVDRELFRITLERAGYAVTEASCGREVLDAIANTRFDLIVLDLSMPEMDGLELLRAVKYIPKPKIIAVTGLAPVFGDRMLEAAKLLGATGTLDKDRAQDLLVPMVRDLLKDRD
jgi:CheY-like chemotaxis protein